MTDKAEELKPRHEVMDAAIRYASSSVNRTIDRTIDGGSAYSFISHQVGLRDALIASQAAEIAALKEREIMRLAGISTAAQGYFKDGESIHTDYDTVALRDVTALYRKYEALRAENAALREGLPVPPRNEYWAQGEYGHD